MCLSLYLLNAGLSCENQKPNRIHSLTGVKGSRKEVSRPLRATTELVVCVEFEWRTVGCGGECGGVHRGFPCEIRTVLYCTM